MHIEVCTLILFMLNRVLPYFKTFLILSLGFVLACQTPKDRPAIQTKYIGEDYPIQETWDGVVTFSDSGFIKAKLTFKHSSQFKKGTPEDRVLDNGLQVDFFNKEGKRTTVLTAKRAIIRPNNDMEAFEDVVIKSEDSTVVETEYMKWLNNVKKIYSDKFVTITKPTEVIRGYGFESDQNMTNYRIFKVSGEANIKDASENGS